MTQKEFKQVLDGYKYSYVEEGNKIIVTHDKPVLLDSLTSLPSDVEFANRGKIRFEGLTDLPPGVVFRNTGYVYFGRLNYIPPGVEFRNKGGLWLNRVMKGGQWFENWNGNIKGIHPVRLFNKMISIGVFDKGWKDTTLIT